MQTYARQGGTSTIFVHDDGLQTLPEAERAERIAFYANHNIGWVARPAHTHHKTTNPDGFARAGRFKKASNMNYGLELSLKLERHLAALEAAGEVNGDEEAAAALTTTTSSWGGEEDASGGGVGMGMCLEDRALELAV